MSHHVFICHATEDKDEFVRPLAEGLRKKGILVWYDEFSMQFGDSLRESIDRGLAACSYGVVVLSKAFFGKRWAIRELNGLVAREASEGRSLILPIWYDVTKEDIVRFSPPLADLLGLKYTGDIENIVDMIVEKLRAEDPYRQFGGRQHVKILDDTGHHAKWIIERAVQVGSNPLGEMRIRVSTAGNISLDSVSPGRSGGIENVSGTPMLRILYDPPIAPGTVFTQQVVFDTVDMYNEEENAANIAPSLPYDSFTLSVEIPYPDRATDIRAYKTIGQRHVPLEGLNVNSDKTEFSITLTEPQVGYLHTLIWKWA